MFDLPIYPGHPITLAVQIAENFETLEAARKTTKYGWPEALSCGEVSGAGGSVYAALMALDKLREGETLDDVLTWADGCQEYAYRDKWPQACEQARRYLQRLDLVEWTKKASAQ